MPVAWATADAWLAASLQARTVASRADACSGVGRSLTLITSFMDRESRRQLMFDPANSHSSLKRANSRTRHRSLAVRARAERMVAGRVRQSGVPLGSVVAWR